jgi:hypothetical protein
MSRRPAYLRIVYWVVPVLLAVFVLAFYLIGIFTH